MSSTEESPYHILEINAHADQDAIKKAFRKLSFRYHPDKHNGTEAVGKFHAVTRAYETINTIDKQTAYNKRHRIQADKTEINDSSSAKDELIKILLSNVSDPSLTDKSNKSISKVKTINHEVTITFQQCFNGCELPLVIERTIEQQTDTHMVTKHTGDETLYISLPCGIDDGEVIVIKDKGNINPLGEHGDIRVKVRVTNDTMFSRVGLDLVMNKTLSLKEALCGFTFSVRHISGQICTIKNNDTIISRGFEQRIPNFGMKRGEHTGFLVIRFDVEFPTCLTTDQKIALQNIL